MDNIYCRPSRGCLKIRKSQGKLNGIGILLEGSPKVSHISRNSVEITMNNQRLLVNIYTNWEEAKDPIFSVDSVLTV